MKHLFIFFFTLISAISFAQTPSVEYIDGYAYINTGSGWEELFIGDRLASSGHLKLDYDSIIELDIAGTLITLTSEQTFDIEQLIQAARVQKQAGGLDSLASFGPQRMLNSMDLRTRSSTGGVRANEANALETIDLTDGTSIGELIEEGQQKFINGDIETSKDSFLEAYDYAINETTISEIAFYLAQIAFLEQDYLGSELYLSEVSTGPEDYFYAEYLLLKGQLGIQNFQFSRALNSLDLIPNSFEEKDPSVWQMGLFLKGLCYQSLGNINQARNFFRQSNTVDPDSELGIISSNMLAHL